MPRYSIYLLVLFVALHVFAKWHDRPHLGSSSDDIVMDAKPFTAQGLDDKPLALTPFSKSHRLTVLVFMESWCGPCKEELPSLRSMHEAFEGAGVGVVGVYRNSTRESMHAMVTKFGATFPVVQDTNGDIFESFSVLGVPTTVVIDDQMRVVRNVQGRDQRLRTFINSKLNPTREGKSL